MLEMRPLRRSRSEDPRHAESVGYGFDGYTIAHPRKNDHEKFYFEEADRGRWVV